MIATHPNTAGPGGSPPSATTFARISTSNPQSDPTTHLPSSRTPNTRSTLRSLASSALAASEDISMNLSNEDATLKQNMNSFPNMPPPEIWRCVLGLSEYDDDAINYWLHCARWKGNYSSVRHSGSSNTSSRHVSTQRSSTCTNRSSLSDPRSSLVSTCSSRTSYQESPNTDSAQNDTSDDSLTTDLQPMQKSFPTPDPSSTDPRYLSSGPWRRLPDLPTPNSTVQPRKGGPKLIHFCTFCPKECSRKSDWIRHEEESHEPQERYSCPDCMQHFPHKHRFVRHHKDIHGCQGCSHAALVRVTLEPKKAFGCGFCGQCITSWEARKHHMATHQNAGMKKHDWDHSRVIWGLLSQDQIQTVWVALLAQRFGRELPLFIWEPHLTGNLQERLERGEVQKGNFTSEYYWSRAAAEAIVQSAFDLASKFPAPVAEGDKMDLEQDAVAEEAIDPSLRNPPILARPDSGVFPSHRGPQDPISDSLLTTETCTGVVESNFVSLTESHLPERFHGEPSAPFSALDESDGPFGLPDLNSAQFRTKSPLRRMARGLDRLPAQPDPARHEHIEQKALQAFVGKPSHNWDEM